jgi:hypothetical protein
VLLEGGDSGGLGVDVFELVELGLELFEVGLLESTLSVVVLAAAVGLANGLEEEVELGEVAEDLGGVGGVDAARDRDQERRVVLFCEVQVELEVLVELDGGELQDGVDVWRDFPADTVVGDGLLARVLYEVAVDALALG